MLTKLYPRHPTTVEGENADFLAHNPDHYMKAG
jgi:hypothetical protein